MGGEKGYSVIFLPRPSSVSWENLIEDALKGEVRLLAPTSEHSSSKFIAT